MIFLNCRRINVISLRSKQNLNFKYKFPSFVLYGKKFTTDPAKDNQVEAIYKELVGYVKNKDTDKALNLYANTKDLNLNFNNNVYVILLSVCQRADHLPHVIQLFNDMSLANIPPTEQSYLAMIRCYSDGGDVDKAIALVKHMISVGIEPKLRTYQPILECLCYKQKDPNSAIELIRHMYVHKIIPRSEQLTLLLETSGRNKTYLNDKYFKSSIDELIYNCSVDIFGISLNESLRIISAINDNSKDQVVENGILIESVETINAATRDKNIPIIYEADKSNHFIWTLNSYAEEFSSSDKHEKDSQQHSDSPVKYTSEKYRLIDFNGVEEIINETNSKISNLSTTYQAESLSSTSRITDFVKLFFSNDKDLEEAVSDQGSLFNLSNATRFLSRQGLRVINSLSNARSAIKYPNKKAELVEISNKSCRCPNCGDYLKSMFLTSDERHKVRVAMMKIASIKSINHCKNLQNFSNWLSERDEFVYIVDGANVAYNKQNFDNGKFSYKQIELVVSKLKADHPNERILVILPYSYSQKVVPNSILNFAGRRVTYLSDEDLEIVDKLQRENMLYVTPPGSDDDWYWIYATVNEERKSPSYVITNDLMRDHRLAFLEPRAFFRWRSNQVIHFEFNKAAVFDQPDPEIYLIPPENFPREIQRTENKRWHIPCVNKKSWMCLDSDPISNTNV